MTLLNRCLVIISNLAAQVPDARKEILKFKMMEMMARAFQVQLVQTSQDTLKNIAWLLRNLTQKINKVYLKDSMFNFGTIIAALV